MSAQSGNASARPVNPTTKGRCAGRSAFPTPETEGHDELNLKNSSLMRLGIQPPVLSWLGHVFTEDVHQTLVGHTLLCRKGRQDVIQLILG
jgi:hypothetical protein